MTPDREAKVWGSVIHLFDNSVSVSILRVEAGHCCSRHWHAKRWNRFEVIRGCIDVIIYSLNADGDLIVISRQRLRAADGYPVPPNMIHRFEVVESGVVVETYWTTDGSDVCQDDIHRIDEGGRLWSTPPYWV